VETDKERDTHCPSSSTRTGQVSSLYPAAVGFSAAMDQLVPIDFATNIAGGGVIDLGAFFPDILLFFPNKFLYCEIFPNVFTFTFFVQKKRCLLLFRTSSLLTSFWFVLARGDLCVLLTVIFVLSGERALLEANDNQGFSSFFCPSICLYLCIYLSMDPSICPSIHLSIYIYLSISVCLSIYDVARPHNNILQGHLPISFVSQSVYLSIYSSICQSF